MIKKVFSQYLISRPIRVFVGVEQLRDMNQPAGNVTQLIIIFCKAFEGFTQTVVCFSLPKSQ